MTKIMENLTLPVTHSDYYNENNVEDGNQQSKRYEEICIVVIFSVFCLLGTLGNGLVIWFGIFRMKKTVNVLWFLSLAVADFSFACFLPMLILQSLLEYWPFAKFMCKLINLLLDLNMIVSVFQLTVISVDRCICVVFPVWCHNHRRPRLALISVLIIWILSLALAISYIPFIDIVNNYDRQLCLLVIDESNRTRMTILRFVFLFLLPFVIMVFCYLVIVLHIRRKRIFTPFKTIMAVIVAFFICWFPYHLFSLLFIFGAHVNFYVGYYGSLIAFSLVIMNTCINPILYVFIGRDFKKKFCGSFQAIFEKAFIEDEDKVDFEKQGRGIALPRLHQGYEEEEVIE